MKKSNHATENKCIELFLFIYLNPLPMLLNSIVKVKKHIFDSLYLNLD